MIHARLAGLGVHREQLVDPRYQLRRQAIFPIQFDGVKYFPARMRAARRVHHPAPAHTTVSGITIGLQNTFIPTQELHLTFATPPHPEVEHDIATRISILPKKRLMILTTPIRHLHRNWCFHPPEYSFRRLTRGPLTPRPESASRPPA